VVARGAHDDGNGGVLSGRSTVKPTEKWRGSPPRRHFRAVLV